MKRNLKLALSSVCLLATLFLSTLSAFPQQSGLVLWNGLGSDTEISNSFAGPNLRKYTGGVWPDVAAVAAYEPGVSGNAITIAGTYSSMSRVHNIVFNELDRYITPDRGTIHVWYKQISDPVGYSKGFYRIFDGAFGFGSGISLDSSSAGLRFGLSFGSTATEVTYNISPLNGTWINVVAVWDRVGLDGSADKLRLYINGEIVAASNIAAWGSTVGPQADIAGGQDGFSAGQFFVDELKVFNRGLSTSEVMELYSGQPPVVTAPVITTQPQSQTVESGTQASLRVSATGAPLNYQWFFNNQSLPGATSAALFFNPVDVTNGGAYFLVISNNLGSVTSSVALLAVTPRTWQTNGGLVLWNGLGSDLEVSNSFVGPNLQKFSGGTWPDVAGVPAYQPGVSGNAITLSGTYSMQNRVRNIVFNNLDRYINADRGTINVWYKQLSDPVGYSKGFYRLFDGAFGLASGIALDSSPAGLRFGLSFGSATITEVTYNISSLNGTWINVAGVWDRSGIEGSDDKLRLYINGEVVAASTSATWGNVAGTRADIAGGQDAYSAGQFLLDELRVFNRALVKQELQNLYNHGDFGVSPTITSFSPSNLKLNEGEHTAFVVQADGSPQLKYQWYYNGMPIEGAGSSTLSLSNLTYADAGLYQVVVSNSFGFATSSNALLSINRAPLANGSATMPINISPNESNAAVVLDASLSRDVDGDLLDFSWFRENETVPFAQGIVAITYLPVGTNVIKLQVSDGMASSFSTLPLVVITTSQALDCLIEVVKTGSANPQPLIASLKAALNAVDRQQPQTAINQLEAFKNKILAQLQPTAPDLAAQFISDADSIITALNGGDPGADATQTVAISSITSGPDGRPHLKIKGVNGRVHVVESSTNLTDWQPVGVATQADDGAYVFEDSTPGQAKTRFYRIESPK